MARTLNRLTDRKVNSKVRHLGEDRGIQPGRHADGGGLYLVVEKNGAKRWSFLYRQNGRLREMGLGGLINVSLADARAKAAEARRILGDRANRGDPIAERRRASGAVPTFGDFADKFLEAKGPGWRNEKHRDQWKMTLTEYAAPLRRKLVNEIATEDVLSVLKPLWVEKPETAARLRGRIERVLDAARAAGHRTGENPARWRGHLDHLLSKRQKLTRGHHAAMSYAEVPAFLVRLRERPAVAALALEFLILTAARTGEVLGAKWSEIDLEARLWAVPAERMKSNREHRVPLTDRTLDILAEVNKLETDDYVFPGQRRGRPLSNMSMEMLLRRVGVDVTVHGFRSAFRDWCGDKTTFPREVAEAALAHKISDETEAAYRRSDALEKRRRLMDAWERYCATPQSERRAVVTSLRATA
jgi:integrase